MNKINEHYRVQIGAKKLWTVDYFRYDREHNLIYIIGLDAEPGHTVDMTKHPIVELFSFYVTHPGVKVIRADNNQLVIKGSFKHIPVIKVTMEEYAVVREKAHRDRKVTELASGGLPSNGWSYPYQDLELQGRARRHEYGDGQRERMAKRIQELLTERGWSIGKLSRECGINHVSVSKYAKGNYKFTTSVDHVWAIAQAFGVDITEFL